MLVKYTKEKMLSLWKLRAGILTADCGCVVGRQDGSDLDTLMLSEIDKWYSDLLLTAPTELLPVRDLSSEASAVYMGDSVAKITLPSSGVRLVGVKCLGWNVELTRFVDADSDLARLQTNKLLRGTTKRPVAVVDGKTLMVYGVMDPDAVVVAADVEISDSLSGSTSIGGVLRELRMVAAPSDGSYIFDESLIP